MNTYLADNTFPSLFKKYRLRSEIETLSEFGDLLAQEGIVYETSLFSKWQNGERIPKERKVILTIIKLFIKLGGIKNIGEANQLISSLSQQNLSQDEQNFLISCFTTININTLSNKPNIYFYTSPLSSKFDQYIEKIYLEIKKIGYCHLYHDAITHNLKNMLCDIEQNEIEYYNESKKALS